MYKNLAANINSVLAMCNMLEVQPADNSALLKTCCKHDPEQLITAL